MVGNRPVLTGVIQVRDGAGFKKLGKIALWNSKVKGAKAPVYTGNVDIDGQKALVSVWSADMAEEVTEEAKPTIKAPVRR